MRCLKQKKVDQLERQLLKNRRLRRDELQSIVSAPDFIGGISARIQAEQIARKVKNTNRDKRAFSLFLSCKQFGMALAALAILLALAASLILMKQQRSSVLNESVAKAEYKDQFRYSQSLVSSTDKIKVTENPGNETQNTSEANSHRSQKTVLKIRDAKFIIRTTNRKAVKKATRQSEVEDKEEEFYPLVFAPNIEEAKENGRIIRVELSRSSLLALGLNPPMENENTTVKTDLLIGSDGLARGIRLVK